MEGTATKGKTTSKGRRTECYCAPKVERRIWSKSDLCSLGCIVYELAMRELAYRNDWEFLGFLSGPREKGQRQVTLQQLLETSCPPRPYETCQMHSEEFEGILRDLTDLNLLLPRMLSKDLQNRPTADELKGLWNRWEGEFDVRQALVPGLVT
jgi:serine/threonine protein kinase